MKEFVARLCDHLFATYGDMTFVNPQVLANAVRIVGEIPEDASPLFMEHWIGQFASVRVNRAHETLAGFNYDDHGEHVIETGRNRSPQERNLTLVHEFGESLREYINAELGVRGQAQLQWEDRYWDMLAVEIVAPLIPFRTAARQNGLDIIDLFKPLSFEGVVQRIKDAFEDDAPVFAVYAKNAAWSRDGAKPEVWKVASSAWTRRWMGVSYRGKQEFLRLPRRHAPITPGSFADDMRRRNRALLVHAVGDVQGKRADVEVLLRPRHYGKVVAQVFAVGVEMKFGDLLRPQLQLVAPEERQGSFLELF